jgi:hypothetical protein
MNLDGLTEETKQLYIDSMTAQAERMVLAKAKEGSEILQFETKIIRGTFYAIAYTRHPEMGQEFERFHLIALNDAAEELPYNYSNITGNKRKETFEDLKERYRNALINRLANT